MYSPGFNPTSFAGAHSFVPSPVYHVPFSTTQCRSSGCVCGLLITPGGNLLIVRLIAPFGNIDLSSEKLTIVENQCTWVKLTCAYIIWPFSDSNRFRTRAHEKEAVMKLGRLVWLTVALLALCPVAHAQDTTL